MSTTHRALTVVHNIDSDGRHTKHPDDVLLAAYMDGAVDAHERRQIEEHLDECATCREAIVAAATVLESHVEAGTTVQKVSPQRTTRRANWITGGIALAASLGLLVINVARSPRDVEQRVPSERAAADDQIGAGEGVARINAIAPAQDAIVGPTGLTMIWGSSGSLRYHVELLAADGTPVWTHETADTTVIVPATVELTPGMTYFWSVDAMRDVIRASTEPRRFRIAN